MKKIKVGIYGAAGYTAGELLRLLYHHPNVELEFVQSDSKAGVPIGRIHQDLFYMDEISFVDDPHGTPDVIFLCKGHGESVRILESLAIDPQPMIIDLSQDFRLKESHPEIQKDRGPFIYGLPELNREIIMQAKNIANPGCFATCIQLALLPLANSSNLNNEVHISAITGSTGAGQKLTPTSHFSWRNNNMSVYKAFQHQHLKEIKQSLKQLQSKFEVNLNFIPYRGNFTRGIISTAYMNTELTQKEAVQLFVDYYAGHPFVRISDQNIHLKQVVNTNYSLLYIEKIEGKLMVISIIDNLLKGASGQAVQNMNLMFGLDEMTGLKLKNSAF